MTLLVEVTRGVEVGVGLLVSLITRGGHKILKKGRKRKKKHLLSLAHPQRRDYSPKLKPMEGKRGVALGGGGGDGGRVSQMGIDCQPS